MSYYTVCPLCGCRLDPGERCDCEDEKKAAVGAANTDSGKAGYGIDAPIPALMIANYRGGFNHVYENKGQL